ncbi:MAG: hypothetical protein KGS61_07925 [Verrucomicrobia bacterium]|nr:hypothetical protein [Verrucomicrobiota bacterium]
MKSKIAVCGSLAVIPCLLAETPFPNSPAPPPPAPPPVVKVPAPTPGSQVDFVVLADSTPPVVRVPSETEPVNAAVAASNGYVYEQKPLAGRPLLVTPDQAKSIVLRFKTAYAKLGNPRILVLVNRELFDEQSRVKLSARTENSTSVSGQTTVSAKNVYRIQEPQTMSLADRQTERDIERLIGRPFRLAGATLADRQTAVELAGAQPAETLGLSSTGDRARQERQALAKIADLAIEVLISSQNVTVAEIAGDRSYAVPDIQATAIRLSDAKILGQASSSDIVGKGPYADWVAQHFDVHDVAEATALSLMEDMLVGLNPEVATDNQ